MRSAKSSNERVRILHTADWHAGRSLMGRDRLGEIRGALAELLEAAREHAVDLVLVAGDLFEQRNPPAAAEAAVWEFFTELGRAGTASVVIAGNHDSPARLDAVAGLLRHTGAHVVGDIRTSDRGGVYRSLVRGIPVQVAAVPFASERRVLRADLQRDKADAEKKPEYRRQMGRLISDLTGGFTNESVNVLMMHGTMEGARLSRTEYEFHSSEHYTLGSTLVPGSTQYVALGHIHEHQEIAGLAANRGRYAGSLIQLDFGEAGQEKAAWVVDLVPGRPAETVARVPLRSGRQLAERTVRPEDLERLTPELALHDGWLKLHLRLSEPRPGLRERIMRELPNVVAVAGTLDSPGEDTPEEQPEDEELDLTAEYGRYWRQERPGSPGPKTLDAFRELLELTVPGEGAA